MLGYATFSPLDLEGGRRFLRLKKQVKASSLLNKPQPAIQQVYGISGELGI